MAAEIEKLRQQMSADFMVSDNLSQRKLNALFIDAQLGNSTQLVAPAGGHKALHLMLPSAEAMAIIDLVPLLFDTPTTGNNYSPTIHTILQSNKANQVYVTDILSDTTMTSDKVDDLVKAVEAETRNERQRLALGFQALNISSRTQVQSDNFAGLLANLTIMGVDMTTVSIGMYDNDFRLEFDLEGVHKTLIYKESAIDYSFSDPNSPTYDWAQHCFDGSPPGNRTVIIDADNQNVGQYVIFAFAPDYIIGNGSSLSTIRQRFSSYRFQKIQPLPYMGQPWGYTDMNGVYIGK